MPSLANSIVKEINIIAAGSLLGVAVNRERYSFPVGKVELNTLYPLDFEEFLMALGEEKLINLIRDYFYSNNPFPYHDTAKDLYKTYLITGGMPAAVKEYIEKRDFNFVLATQKNINDSYIADMAKYATANETTKIMAAFNSIPAQLAKDNKKFQYRLIKFGIPANAVLVDTPSFNGFKGALTENYIAFSLTAKGYVPYYWESNGQAELDFLIQDNYGNIIPVEVKAAENVRAKSLNQFIKKYNPPYSIRISGKNFGFENGIKSVPLYAAFLI